MPPVAQTHRFPIFDASTGGSRLGAHRHCEPRVTDRADAAEAAIRWTTPLRCALERARARARAAGLAAHTALPALGVPRAAVAFWAVVVLVDFTNDWVIAGVVGRFRPVELALTDMAVWWAPWILASPALALAARALSPTRTTLRRSALGHCAVMLASITVHAWLAAWLFDLVAGSPGRTAARFGSFAVQFTLSEALLYWGFVATLHLSEAPPATASLAGQAGEPTGEGRRGEADDALLPATRFAVRDRDVTRFVPVDDVDYIEAAGNYVRLHVGTDEHLIRSTLSGVLARLDRSHFRRIHRSIVVNVDRVEEVTAWFNGDHMATLADGRRLKVSRTYRAELLEPLS